MSEDEEKTTEGKAVIHYDAEGIPDIFNPPSEEELEKLKKLGQKIRAGEAPEEADSAFSAGYLTHTGEKPPHKKTG